MAAVVTTKAPGTATKVKKPSVSIPANAANNKPGLPSASPSGTTKRLPGQAQAQTNAAMSNNSVNGVARLSRRPQRLNTRMSTSDNLLPDKKATIHPEPYVITEKFILKKFRGKPPSLVIHLHPTQFKFGDCDEGFRYDGELRPMIEGLKNKTIPHDFLEQFRREGVRLYDGWIMVKVIDHRTASKSSDSSKDDQQLGSINNYTQHITPSPYVPHPAKEQPPVRSSPGQNGTTAPAVKDPTAADAQSTSQNNKPTKIREFWCALGPSGMSKYIDLQLDLVEVDPKSRRNNVTRTNTNGPPSTPITQFPPTPTSEKPPPPKKQKLRIDPKDHLEYEAKVVNATAPPLYLDPVEDFEEAQELIRFMSDPRSTKLPSSPTSRKRTSAELAADDAYAKGMERFMQIMDPKTSGSANAAAGVVDSGSTAFQPRFDKFNTLQNIKRDQAEKKQRDKDRQLQEDEQRRSQQQQIHEQERQRAAQQAMMAKKQQAQAAAMQQQQAQQQRQNQELLAQQQAQNMQRPGTANRPQPTGIPPNMQNQMGTQAASPVIRQGTPLAASSPAGTARPMIRDGSQTGGAASPARPGSSLQHNHPNANAAVNMMRQASGQQNGASLNGTPHMPHSTPGPVNATPIMRQGTPGHGMMQASPTNMMATPQMNAAMMSGQMPNGVARSQPTQEQMQQMRMRQQMQAQAAGGMNGQGMPNPAAMAATQAQYQAQIARQAAMRQQQQMQAQSTGMQMGTPQAAHASPNPQAGQVAGNYHTNMSEQVKQRLADMQKAQGSPAPGNQMTPQQQQQMQAMRQQMAAQQQGGQQIQRPQQSQQMQNILNSPAFRQMQQRAYQQIMLNEAQKYGGDIQMIPEQQKQQVANQARQRAWTHFQQMRQSGAMNNPNQRMMSQMQMQQQQGGQQGMPNMGMVNPHMAAQMQQQQQNQQAQHMQQLQMANAQQQLMHAQANSYQNQLQQMQMQQQHMMNQGGQR